MLKSHFILFCFILWTTHAFAGPFTGAEAARSETSTCKYSNVYDASQKTFLILNLVHQLSQNYEDLKTEGLGFFEKTVQSVSDFCESDELQKIRKVRFEDGVLIFDFGSGEHQIEWIKKEDSDYVVYTKKYGTYKNEPLMVVHKKNEAIEFVRITGRLGAEARNQRYTFYYKGGSDGISSSVALNNKNSKDIRSLHSIYKGEEFRFEPVLQIGVIGTGLDYNHKGVAKHLAYRDEMEKDLLELEILEFKLRESPFADEESYHSAHKKFTNLKRNVGFPIWMDQAMGTNMPYDQVVVNNAISRQGTQEHETRVTSRMLRSGGRVKVHFARRSMGSVDTFDVREVVSKFVSQGVRLINLSFGAECGRLLKEDFMWQEVFAKNPDVVFVVSAGNSGLNTEVRPFCPAVYSTQFKNVISVTALDSSGQLAVYFGTPVNFGNSVDLAIRSDNLEVLIPYRKNLKWENNADGATSLAAAEVSRILTESILEGLNWDAQTVKEQLVRSSLYRPYLKGVNRSSSELDEWAFRAVLKNGSRL